MTSRSAENASSALASAHRIPAPQAAPSGSEAEPGSNGVQGLLAAAIVTTTAKSPPSSAVQADGERLAQFLSEDSLEQALLLWFGRKLPQNKDQLTRRLACDIARIDEMLTGQVNGIIHHPQFQKLEASWRSLRYLVQQVTDGAHVKIRMLSVTWKELTREFERAMEFDQSELFRKIYSNEFGVAGGEPFGLLIGDYEIRPTPSKTHPFDDVSTLRGLSQVAAAAFAPFIAAAHPSLFALDDFSGLERSINWERVFEQKTFLAWRSFREQYEDARFIGLTVPRVLGRLPYDESGLNGEGELRVDTFRFHEDVSGIDPSRYLWGNAAYAFGAVVIRAFADSRWLADIRGVQRGVEGGGLVTGLPVHSFSTDKQNVIQKCSTDVIITDVLEKELSELGFIPLCHCKDTEYSAFYSNHSVQKPKKYDRLAATINARLTSMLQYTLCVSRFAHYLKVLARDKVGSFANAQDCEHFLQQWLVKYVTPDEDASAEAKARLPLREAKVQVKELPGQAGRYECVVHLWPHHELDDLTAAVRVRAQLATAERPS